MKATAATATVMTSFSKSILFAVSTHASSSRSNHINNQFDDGSHLSKLPVSATGLVLMPSPPGRMGMVQSTRMVVLPKFLIWCASSGAT